MREIINFLESKNINDVYLTPAGNISVFQDNKYMIWVDTNDSVLQKSDKIAFYNVEVKSFDSPYMELSSKAKCKTQNDVIDFLNKTLDNFKLL